MQLETTPVWYTQMAITVCFPSSRNSPNFVMIPYFTDLF